MRLVATTFLSLFTLTSAAQQVPVDVQTQIIQGLKNGPAGLEVKTIESTPVDGIYQVTVSGDQVFYSSADGQFIMTGKMYQVAEGKVTDVVQLKQSLDILNTIKSIPIQDTITYAAIGKKQYQLYVFTDVDCPYCAKLHQQVPQLNRLGVEVVYLAYPRAGLDAPSFSKIASVWCSDDRQKSLNRMFQNEEMSLLDCDDRAITAQYQLAKQIGLQGTPATFFPDGKMMYGFHSAEDLVKMLTK